jgi:hypothetical protein
MRSLDLDRQSLSGNKKTSLHGPLWNTQRGRNNVGENEWAAKLIKTTSKYVNEVKAFMPEHQDLADAVQKRIDQIELQLQSN